MSSNANIFLSPGSKGTKWEGQRLEFPLDSAKEFTVGSLQDTFHATACLAIKGEPWARLSPKDPSRTAIPPFIYSLGKEKQAGWVASSWPRERNHTSCERFLCFSISPHPLGLLSLDAHLAVKLLHSQHLSKFWLLLTYFNSYCCLLSSGTRWGCKYFLSSQLQPLPANLHPLSCRELG